MKYLVTSINSKIKAKFKTTLSCPDRQKGEEKSFIDYMFSLVFPENQLNEAC
jgi:hypothetical protein